MRISDWSSDVCSSDLFGGRRNLARQRRLYRLNSSSSFGGVRTAPLSHIRPAAATLASQCLNPDTNEIDRTLVRDQIIRHAHRYGSATINHRNKRADSAAEFFLVLIDQPAQLFGIQALDHLTQKADIANLLRASGISSLAAADESRVGKE